jgi:hypothetical protein
MRRLLHVLTRVEEPLAMELIERQREQSGCDVEVVELFQPQPDYEVLLKKIFAADSVQVW